MIRVQNARAQFNAYIYPDLCEFSNFTIQFLAENFLTKIWIGNLIVPFLTQNKFVGI